MASGLRELKKQRTRQQLVETAVRLFDQRGYEVTTVGEIAAAVEVSPATFYKYFPSKEDLLFADGSARVELLARALDEPPAGRAPAEALVAAVERLLTSPDWSLTPDSELVPVRARLIASVPALRARALLEIAELQQQWSELLVERHPDELDEVAAAAMTGAVIGAILAVVGQALRTGTTESLTELVHRACSFALSQTARDS